MGRSRHPWGMVIAFAIVSFGAAGTRADELSFRGSTIRGTVVGVTATGVEFQPDTTDNPEFPASRVLVPYESIEAVSTEGNLHVLHGDDEETIGRVVGVRDGILTIETDGGNLVAIDVSTIHSSLSDKAYQGSMLSRLRSRYRYWKGGADFGFNLTRSTVNFTGFAFSLFADRKKAPSRLRLESAFKYSNQKQKDPDGDKKKTIDDSIAGLIRYDYDLTDHLSAFGSGDAKYDGIQQVSIRAVPKAGVGYYILRSKTFLVSVEAGGAYIYERFFSGDSNDFFSVAFGKQLEADLPYGAKFAWRTDYLPAIEDWSNDYLLRTSAALTCPLTDFLAFKATVLDEYDGTPAEGSEYNLFSTLLGVSVTF